MRRFVKSSSNYVSFLDELLTEFTKAEPELNAAWSERAVEKVIVQYCNGMPPGKDDKMRDYFRMKFINNLETIAALKNIKTAMASHSEISKALKPVVKSTKLPVKAVTCNEDSIEAPMITTFHDPDHWLECDH